MFDFRLSAIALAAAVISPAAHATDFVFNTDPFAGSTALTTPGRQIVGGEPSIPVFDFGNDKLLFDFNVFGVTELTFFNEDITQFPAAGANFIVLETFDADGDPNNGVLMNAGLAANLIADTVTTPGAGFFIYFNSGLDLPRLVFSTDLDSAQADLKILARFTGLTGEAGREAMPSFSAANVGGVPEPATWAMLISGFGLVGGVARRRRQAPTAA